MSGTGPELPEFNSKIAQAMVDAGGKVPGLPRYLGIVIEEITPGKLVATMPVREELVTMMGAIHGGVMAGFVDHALGCVLYPLMKPGQWAATTEFKINYLAAVKSGVLRADSQVVSCGRRSAVVRVDVTNDGRLVCVAQGTLLISDPPGTRKE
ncbi:MAG TPA: PaaI family thioesterase [Candidatus Limnocylindrales bacterium]|nr:PaaI family thioesterase [Candidatus Limnocylindrales bacterium]